MPVFSRAWWAGKPFDQVVMDIPIASGPYRRPAQLRPRYHLRSRSQLWGRDLNVRRGLHNFDRVTYKIYKDTTHRPRPSRRGEFDYLRTFSAREWARTYVGKKFDWGIDQGRADEQERGGFSGLPDQYAARRVQGCSRAASAWAAFDFEWMNRQLMYAYTRVKVFPRAISRRKGCRDRMSLQCSSHCAPSCPPRYSTKKFLKRLLPLPKHLRSNLRKARELLAKSGWTYRDGALRSKGRGATARIPRRRRGTDHPPFSQALGKLGIQVDYRRADFALIQKRLDVFDFDVFTVRVPGSESPGSELMDRYGSKSADTEARAI